MDDGTHKFSCSYGAITVDYSIRNELVTVRFDLDGPSKADSYAQLWQNGNLVGTRNGTPLFYDRDTEEGELNFDAAYPYICNSLIENAHKIDDRTVHAIRRGAGIDLSDFVRRRDAA